MKIEPNVNTDVGYEGYVWWVPHMELRYALYGVYKLTQRVIPYILRSYSDINIVVEVLKGVTLLSQHVSINDDSLTGLSLMIWHYM